MKKLILFVISCCFVTAVSAQEVMPRLISVQGHAEQAVTPNEVHFTVGIEANSMDLDEAKAETDRLARDVLAVFNKHGINEEQVQTTRLNIEPRYRNNYEARDFRGYFISQSLNVVLKDVSAFDMVLTALLKSGAHPIRNIKFHHSNMDILKEALKIEALRNAKMKAVKMADVLNQDLGQPYSIVEGVPPIPRPHQPMMMRAMAGAPTSNSPTIAAGKLTLEASVQVSFELEHKE